MKQAEYEALIDRLAGNGAPHCSLHGFPIPCIRCSDVYARNQGELTAVVYRAPVERPKRDWGWVVLALIASAAWVGLMIHELTRH